MEGPRAQITPLPASVPSSSNRRAGLASVKVPRVASRPGYGRGLRHSSDQIGTCQLRTIGDGWKPTEPLPLSPRSSNAEIGIGPVFRASIWKDNAKE